MKASEAWRTRRLLLKNARDPQFSTSLTVKNPKGYCWACGTEQVWISAQIINDELAENWGLSQALRDSFDARESMFCPNCRCSFRLRQIAHALTDYYGGKSLQDLVTQPEFRQLKVAEINSCGNLHHFIGQLPGLAYSEFGSKDKAIPSEDLEHLSYPDDTFDIVLTSDTLEHVPRFEDALSEIRRVLKPGGRHIFTVPAVWNRQTVRRAMLDSKGKVKNIQKPTYHGAGQPDYLVFSEFGNDIVQVIESHDFSVKLFEINPVNLNDTSCVLITKKLK